MVDTKRRYVVRRGRRFCLFLLLLLVVVVFLILFCRCPSLLIVGVCFLLCLVVVCRILCLFVGLLFVALFVVDWCGLVCFVVAVVCSTGATHRFFFKPSPWSSF